MEIKRLVSYLFVGLLAILLWQKWQHDHPSAATDLANETATPTETAPNSSAQADIAHYVPSTPASVVSATGKTGSSGSSTPQPANFDPKSVDTVNKNKLIVAKTDVLKITIDPQNGQIISAELLKYPLSLMHSHVPVSILQNNPKNFYIAKTGLRAVNAKTATTLDFEQPKQLSYQLAKGQSTLTITLRGSTSKGLQVRKTYTLKAGSYTVNVNYQMRNTGSTPWQGSLYTQLIKTATEQQHSGFLSGITVFEGGSVSTPKASYRKFKYAAMGTDQLSDINQVHWVALQQKYFLTSWIPSQKTARFYSYRDSNNHILVGFVGNALRIAPQQNATTQATLYVGPELAKNLAPLAPHLERTAENGIFWFISAILLGIMQFIYKLIGNWGWAIVLTTIFIKIAFYWFSAKSFRSMARMREIQPRLQALKERHGDDRQALSRATMELYRKEKINPMGGCLPILIQLPVFYGLYYVLAESVQLRQAPFMFWIHDLSVRDPYFILPILMGLSMLLQQKLTPSTADPAQAKVMMILPVVFTVFFAYFPAGLVLYWLVNNLVQSLQQWYVTKTYDAHTARQKQRRNKQKK